MHNTSTPTATNTSLPARLELPLKILLTLLVTALGLFNVLYLLGQQPIALFDEAREMGSALEMLANHHYAVTFFQGQPDYWNAKPPLQVWVCALGHLLLPDGLLGMRLASPLAFIADAILVFMLARRFAGYWWALLACLLLVTLQPYIIFSMAHGARTADPDMLFNMLVSAAMLLALQERRATLAAAYVCLGIAFLLKSFHAGVYASVVFFYSVLLWRRGQLPLRDMLLLPLLFALPVLPWAVARYQFDGTRFFEAMVFNDVVRRATVSMYKSTGADVSWLYYPRTLVWHLPVLTFCASLGMAFGSRARLWRNPQVALLLLWLLVPLAAYSLAHTRLIHYSLGFVPPLLVLGVMLLKAAFEFFQGAPAAAATGVSAVRTLAAIGVALLLFPYDPVGGLGLVLLLLALALRHVPGLSGRFSLPAISPLVLMFVLSALALALAALRLPLLALGGGILLALVFFNSPATPRQQFALAGGVVLLLTLYFNERFIYLEDSEPPADPVTAALTSLSAQAAPGKALVYLDNPDNAAQARFPGTVGVDFPQDLYDWRQDYYTTAVLLGHVEPGYGGKPAFLAAPHGVYLVEPDGQVVQHP